MTRTAVVVSESAPPSWLPRALPDGSDAGARTHPLFLLPAAGASSSLYRDWPTGLASGFHPSPVELPGRGSRMAEPPADDLPGLARSLDQSLTPPSGRPWALLGHSMGALLAAAWAAAALSRGCAPAAVYLSAALPPWAPADAVGRDRPATAAGLARLDPADFWPAMVRLGGIPPALSANASARRLLEPLLRADVLAAALWRPSIPVSLGCRVVCFVGRDDPAVSARQLSAWRACTEDFACHELPGGHFYRNGLIDLLAPVDADLASRRPTSLPTVGREGIDDRTARSAGRAAV